MPGHHATQRSRLSQTSTKGCRMLLDGLSHVAFETIRSRLDGARASDGTVNDFGTDLSLYFRDPDGPEGEVLVRKR